MKKLNLTNTQLSYVADWIEQHEIDPGGSGCDASVFVEAVRNGNFEIVFKEYARGCRNQLIKDIRSQIK